MNLLLKCLIFGSLATAIASAQNTYGPVVVVGGSEEAKGMSTAKTLVNMVGGQLKEDKRVVVRNSSEDFAVKKLDSRGELGRIGQQAEAPWVAVIFVKSGEGSASSVAVDVAHVKQASVDSVTTVLITRLSETTDAISRLAHAAYSRNRAGNK